MGNNNENRPAKGRGIGIEDVHGLVSRLGTVVVIPGAVSHNFAEIAIVVGGATLVNAGLEYFVQKKESRERNERRTAKNFHRKD